MKKDVACISGGIKVEGTRFDMQGSESVLRLSIPSIIQIIETLNALDSITEESTSLEIAFELIDADLGLQALFETSPYSPYLNTSRNSAKRLRDGMGAITALSSEHAAKPLGWRAALLRRAREEFKLVFLQEISMLPIFLVANKRPYDMSVLIHDGAALFPSSLLQKVPEAAADAAELGRALAFNLSTACGFHTFRVTESSLRRYWDNVSRGTPRPSLQTMGSFASELDQRKFGDTKIVEALKQFTKLHRNPCIHPDVILSDEEAVGILGMARSVVGAMLAVLPDAPQETSTE